MKSLSISTALSLLVLSAAAPFAWAVGDPNTDTGVGSAASRGPYGFSNNNDAVYDTPTNSYGVYRDAQGALRDHGMIPDNLTTRVPEPTWEESRRRNPGPMPGGGAPGGLGGGGVLGFGGGFGGLPILGGFGIGAGLGGFGLGFGNIGAAFPTVGAAFPALGQVGVPGPFQFPVGTATNPLGFNGGTNAAIGVNGLGPAGQALRTQLGFANSPGNSTFQWPSQTQRFLGPGGGFLPNFRIQTQNTVFNNGGNQVQRFQHTPMGVIREMITNVPNPDGTSTITRDFWALGNHMRTQETMSTAALQADPVWQNTFSKDFRTDDFVARSNNAFTNPFVQNNPNNVSDNSFIARGSTGNFGAGFATPQTSGDQRSAFFTDNQATGTSGGFSTPRSSGSERSPMFTADFGQGSLGGFATPQTSGSERSLVFGNVNNRFGGNGIGGGIGGGISAGTGNRAFLGGGGTGTGTASGGSGEDVRSDGSLTGTTGTGAQFDEGGTGFRSGAAGNGTGGGATGAAGNGTSGALGGVGPIGFGGTGLPTIAAGLTGGGGGFTSGVFGPLTAGGGAPVGSMGSRTAIGPLPVVTTIDEIAMRRVIPPANTAGGATRDFFNELTIAPFVQQRVQQTRMMNQGIAVTGAGSQHNVGTSGEQKLAAMCLTPMQAIGRVIGSMRYANGDVITFGSKGTLRLAPDNSGSLTLNSGEILTFKKVPRELRAIALRSTLIF